MSRQRVVPRLVQEGELVLVIDYPVEQIMFPGEILTIRWPLTLTPKDPENQTAIISRDDLLQARKAKAKARRRR